MGINTLGSFTVDELPPSLAPTSGWRTAQVAYVENSEGTVYLAVRGEKGTTLYPLVPEAVAA